MGINDNGQGIGEINKNANVTDDKELGEIFTNSDVTDDGTDADMGLNNNTKPKQIDVITGTKYDNSLLTSRTGDPKKSSNVTPDKGHMKNLVTSSPLWKYPICLQ